MALTAEDLNNIRNIVRTEVKTEVSDIKEQMVTKNQLRQELDRMEGRLTTAIGLLQRDTFARLDQHDARIARLEKAIGG